MAVSPAEVAHLAAKAHKKAARHLKRAVRDDNVAGRVPKSLSFSQSEGLIIIAG
jgi:hypothetical protein